MAPGKHQPHSPQSFSPCWALCFCLPLLALLRRSYLNIHMALTPFTPSGLLSNVIFSGRLPLSSNFNCAAFPTPLPELCFAYKFPPPNLPYILFILFFSLPSLECKPYKGRDQWFTAMSSVHVVAPCTQETLSEDLQHATLPSSQRLPHPTASAC